MIKKFLSMLFDPPLNISWGLMGDHGLWLEMQEGFASTPMPASSAELTLLIAAAYFKSTGQLISNTNLVYMERFDKGGSSHGLVCPEWWRDKGLPGLIQRWEHP